MVTLSGIGRLGKDPQMQYTPQGNALTRMNVAVDCGFGDNKNTVWLSLVAFGKQAETLNQYLKKGSRLNFVAELQKVGTYEKQSGVGVNVDAKIIAFSFVDKSENVQSDEVEELSF